MDYHFEFREFPENIPEVEKKFESNPNGEYCYGLYLEGARWSDEEKCLTDCKDNELIAKVPIFLLIPKREKEINKENTFECPIYETQERTGIVGKNLQSTNSVMFVRFPTKNALSFWLKRGTALISQIKQ